MCNIEFPHFGASYPDAHCIYGYLWDMDSYEDGCYTIGGYDPCPFCNTEEWLKTVLDNEEFASREEALAWVEKMREMWGANHFHDTTKKAESEIPKGLEEAAEKSLRLAGFHNMETRGMDWKGGFIAGAKWQAEQEQETIELAEDHAYFAGKEKLREAILEWARGKKEEYEKETSKEYDGCIWVLNLLIEKLESL